METKIVNTSKEIKEGKVTFTRTISESLTPEELNQRKYQLTSQRTAMVNQINNIKAQIALVDTEITDVDESLKQLTSVEEV